MRKIIIIFCLLILSGCATEVISNTQAKEIQSSQILDNSYTSKTKNRTKVTIKRDSGYVGSICSSIILINSKPIAKVNSSEKVTLYLPKGEYIIGANSGVGICGGVLKEVIATIKDKTPISFRIGYSYDFFINQTSF